jgi:hypothetical protein
VLRFEAEVEPAGIGTMFSDTAKSAILFIFMPGGGSVFGAGLKFRKKSHVVTPEGSLGGF